MMKFSNVKKILFFVTFSSVWSPIDLKSEPLSCETSAFIALLMNAENGKVLFAKNAEIPLYPASTTKVATALYALYQKGDSLDQLVTVSADAVSAVPPAIRRSGKHPSYRLEFGGTLMGLKTGEQVDLKSLLYGLMLPSGNDAANVIAEMVSGSTSQFVLDLNAFLKKIGCKNTCFKNPHGLPDEDHITTAKDLAIMAQVGMKDPVFRQIVSSTRYLKPQTNKQPEVVLLQHNSLVKPGSKHFYPYATGVKIGYTIRAGHTIVASAEKGDRFLVAVVCHRESAEQRYRSTMQLFEAAFQEPKQIRTLFSEAHDVFQEKVEGAKDVLKAGLSQDLVVSFYPSEEKNFYSHIKWDDFSLPIACKKKVGEMQIFDDRGVLYETAPLFAMKAVEPTFAYKMQKITKQGKKWLQKHRVYIAYLMAFVLLMGAVWKVVWRKKERKV